MVIAKNIQKLIINYSNGKYSHAFLVETNNFDKCLNDLKEFIKFINCPEKYDENCKKECNLCKLINLNNLPSLLIVEPDGLSIKKNQLLEIQEKFSTKPVYSKFNIYIVCNAESMNEASANCILKFLEEPEDNIIGFFITTNKEKILSTIKSRCELVKAFYTEEKVESDYDYYALALEYITKILKEKNLLINKEFILTLNFNRAQISQLFKEMFNIYMDRIKNKYFPGNIFDISNENVISHLEIIEKSLQEINANVSIELILDKFVIEMRNALD